MLRGARLRAERPVCCEALDSAPNVFLVEQGAVGDQNEIERVGQPGIEHGAGGHVDGVRELRRAGRLTVPREGDVTQGASVLGHVLLEPGAVDELIEKL